MKPEIHPAYQTTTVTCTCGNTFTTRSTSKSGDIHADVCSACHPFYTGKQKILDTGGRVARFEQRFGKFAGTGRKAANDKATTDKAANDKAANDKATTDKATDGTAADDKAADGTATTDK